jgi:hypothetical protein
MVGAAEDFAAATASLLPLAQLRHTTSDLLLSGVPLLLHPPRGVTNNDPAWASRLSRLVLLRAEKEPSPTSAFTSVPMLSPQELLPVTLLRPSW